MPELTKKDIEKYEEQVKKAQVGSEIFEAQEHMLQYYVNSKGEDVAYGGPIDIRISNANCQPLVYDTREYVNPSSWEADQPVVGKWDTRCGVTFHYDEPPLHPRYWWKRRRFTELRVKKPKSGPVYASWPHVFEITNQGE